MARLVEGLLKHLDSNISTLTRSQSTAISYLRVLALIMIVSCHFLQKLDNKWAWVLNIGVQIFFLISGYLYGFKQIDNWILWLIKRIRKVYIPYIIVVFAFTPMLFLLNPNLKSLIKHLICYITDTQWLGGGYDGLNHLWFITVIFICYIIGKRPFLRHAL